MHLLLFIIYLSFISLGLPDSLLGSAWPAIYPELSVPVSYSGIIFFIVSAGTVISSLLCHRATKALGTGKVTAISVLTTAAALFGFSISGRFLHLCLWAIPYGLGAGCVDASLNNYVAIHYKSRHMSWLHSMWGIGATAGPAIMSMALARNLGWHSGYRSIALIQIALSAVLFLSLRLWNKEEAGEDRKQEALSLMKIISIPRVKAVMLTFFCYCALEQTASLWISSYMVLSGGESEAGGAIASSLFFIGITGGRMISGFLTFRLSDKGMIRLGQVLIASGIALLLIPARTASLIGIAVIGLGCAPIYPSVIHSVPGLFGRERSQAVIGVLMASAYIGNCTMPPLFGFLASKLSADILPLYLLLVLAVMAGGYAIAARRQ